MKIKGPVSVADIPPTAPRAKTENVAIAEQVKRLKNGLALTVETESVTKAIALYSSMRQVYGLRACRRGTTVFIWKKEE